MIRSFVFALENIEKSDRANSIAQFASVPALWHLNNLVTFLCCQARQRIPNIIHVCLYGPRSTPLSSAGPTEASWNGTEWQRMAGKFSGPPPL